MLSYICLKSRFINWSYSGQFQNLGEIPYYNDVLYISVNALATKCTASFSTLMVFPLASISVLISHTMYFSQFDQILFQVWILIREYILSL